MMRISAEKSDPGYNPAVRFCSVLLSGVKQKGIITADDDTGYLKRYVMMDDMYVNDESGENAVVETENPGEVEILLATQGAPLLAIPNSIRTANWLEACGKEVHNPSNIAVQVGVHVEEMMEFMDQLHLTDEQSDVRDAVSVLKLYAKQLKTGILEPSFSDPVETLDALCDMEVTGNGVAYLMGWNKQIADQRVLKANDDKLVDGKPVILPGGKIGKPEGWVAADLRDCV